MISQSIDKKVLFWDFDGVIIHSDAIRESGFRTVLMNYPKDQVDQLIDFHKQNGGLSRYVKLRHFFNVIREVDINENEINRLASSFSEIMLRLLKNKSLLINETLHFIKINHSKYNMHIVSGSDQTELRTLCSDLDLTPFFISIYGSPTPKSELVRDLILNHNYSTKSCLLIGDSINDYEAAKENKIDFMAYNNEQLNRYSTYNLSFNPI